MIGDLIGWIVGGVFALLALFFGGNAMAKRAGKSRENEIRTEVAEKRVEDITHAQKLREKYEEMPSGRVRDRVTKKWVRKPDGWDGN